MYQVVFTGRLLKGADRVTVESELQRLFKANAAQVEWFLRGKAIVVKSCDDALVAGRYYEALSKAGLECELRSDQPASVPVATPPEQHTAPREQLPIPEVPDAGTAAGSRTHASRHRVPVAATPPPKPATPSPAQSGRRTPTLGPVTQAITAQDRAAVFVAADAATPVASPGLIQPRTGQRLRSGASLAFLVIGAILVGTLAYFVRQEWLERKQPPAPVPVTQVTPTPTVAVEPETQTPEELLVGRWQCVEAGSGRVVENEFTAEGRYRSLAHGRPDAFQQVDQIDVLVEGRYRLEGKKVVVHVQNIPSREAFGGSARADDYLYWRIDTLTRDALVWADMQLEEVSESCLRSQALVPKPG